MDLRDEIESLIKKNWPQSTVSVAWQRDSLFISFALWTKKDWPNGIARNDPAYHQIWVWNATSDSMTLELSQGGSLWGFNAERLGKIGWRNARGDRKKILRTLELYFGGKLKKAVREHWEALDYKRQMNRKAENQELGLRKRLIRLAYTKLELREHLLPLLKGDKNV